MKYEMDLGKCCMMELVKIVAQRSLPLRKGDIESPVRAREQKQMVRLHETEARPFFFISARIQ